jgi:hypothetical protein
MDIVTMSDRLLPGFIVRVAASSSYDHWQGGPAVHEGAYCDTCKRPWLLLWDINCADPRFEVDGRMVFGNLERLPIYYCWKCVADMAYRVVDSQRIHVFESNGVPQGDDFPYGNYPIQFQRHPIELTRASEMPDDVREFLTEETEKTVSDDLKRQLEFWLDHPISCIDFDIWWQQFAGEPWLMQGPEEFSCPNEVCEAGRRHAPMKVLAAICNHPLGGLPMIQTIEDVKNSSGVTNRWVQVVVHMCPECHTIHVCNRCD